MSLHVFRSQAPAVWVTLYLLGLGGCTPQTVAPRAEGGADVLNVADAAIAGNNPQMALSVSQAVLASDPRNTAALYHEAAAYYAMGRCQDAIAAYKVALGIDPASSQARTGIGRCLLQRDAAQAEQAFAAAVRDDPGNAAALNDLGIARDLQGNYAGAQAPLQQALLLAPGSLAIEVNLGLSEALAGDADGALEYLGPLATGTEADAKIRQDYAAALVAAGRRDEAAQVLAVDLPPAQVQALIADFTAVMAGPQRVGATLPSPAQVADAAGVP